MADTMLILVENFKQQTKKSVVDVLLVFLLVLGYVAGDVNDAIHLLQVKPPLVLIVGLSVSEKVIKPYRQAPSYPGMAHGPVYSPVEGRVRLVPWTDLDACAAT